MTWSIIIGNGFTIDAQKHCGLKESSSFPWDWKIKNPENPKQLLIDVMPHLKKHLESQGLLSELSVYDALETVIRETQNRPPYKSGEMATSEDHIHVEACHFLRLAYAWFSEKFTYEKLNNWSWRRWFAKKGPGIETILSYNYDTVLESVMRSTHLGKVYGSSRQNFLFGENLFSTPPEVYWDEEKGDKKVIHIAKPHGSCNFSGWGVREVLDENGKRPLYPIEGIMARDSTLKILTGSKIHAATSAADLVLPGEWSCWGDDKSTRVPWSTEQKQHFIDESKNADKLLVVGFGYCEPDRPEFDDILGRISKFKEVYVVNPSPTKELISAVKPFARKKFSVLSSPLALMD